MKRIFWNILAFFSATLLLASLLLSLRSISMGDYLRWHGQSSIVELDSGQGLFSIGWGEVIWTASPPTSRWAGSFSPFYQSFDPHQIDLRRGTKLALGLDPWKQQSARWSGAGHIFVVPYWLLATCFGVLPLIWIRAWLRGERRRRAGLCPFCGYDLRASKGRCPECGAKIRRFYR